MRRSSTKERARKSSTASSDGTTQERARRLQSTVLHSSEVGATHASERLYANGALQQLRANAPLISAVDKEIVVDSFGLEAAVALGYPAERREDHPDALVPCNRLGCWFAFDDLQTAAQKLLGRDERYATELCFQILADLGLYEFYASASRGLAWVETADRPADGLPLDERTGGCEPRKNVVVGCCWTRSPLRRWRPRALAAEDPDGAPSQVDDLVNLLGGDATVPLLKVLRRLSVDKWVTTAELLAPLRALTSAESAVDGTLRVLKLLEAHGMGICLDRVGASPLLDQPLLPALEAAARRWVTHELQKAKRWRERLRGAEVEALYALLAADDDEAAAAVPAPRPPAEREWASFCAAYAAQFLRNSSAIP